MKKLKKLLNVFCCSLGCLLPFAQNQCFATAYKRVKAFAHPANIRLHDTKSLQERAGKIQKHLAKGYIIMIIDGGSYYDTARADGFEAHHLISAHFCRKHPERLSVSQAPTVLIPKAVHYRTGSHIRNKGVAAMTRYHQLEEKVYAVQGSLHDVVRLGLQDLVRAFEEESQLHTPTRNKVRSYDTIMQTPIARALMQVDWLSPNGPELKREQLLTPTSYMKFKSLITPPQTKKKQKTKLAAQVTSSSLPTSTPLSAAATQASIAAPVTPLGAKPLQNRLRTPSAAKKRLSTPISQTMQPCKKCANTPASTNTASVTSISPNAKKKHPIKLAKKVHHCKLSTSPLGKTKIK